MDAKEFSVKLAIYYNEALTKNDQPNVKLVMLEKWLGDGKFTAEQLTVMFNRVVISYTPTAINPFPLIPHIISICEIQTTDKSKTELARTIADKIIKTYSTGDYNYDGGYAKVKSILGDLAYDIVSHVYGNWYHFSEAMQRNDQTETTRAHLRDSALAYINRKEKGIENQPPKLEDLHAGNITRVGTLEPVSNLLKLEQKEKST
jgi:hypothetical protein